MRVLATIAALLIVASTLPANAGPCNSPNDRASDGSRCGGRSSSERPGGR